MTEMLQTVVGKVEKIVSRRTGLTEVKVIINGKDEAAVNYDLLTGEIETGDQVVLNTTAVVLGLGTGGYHFILSNLSRPETDLAGGGHIMKLRYTPQQIKILSVEEKAAGYSDIFDNFSSLDGIPVVIIPLHSCLAPVAVSFKNIRPHGIVVYIMTDEAALPVWFSTAVHQLTQKGYINKVITCGHAFGGDLEAVNIYSSLIAAKEILGADAVIIGMGPGNVGTGTKWGFSGIHLGEMINAVNILGGRPVFCPRVSFNDSRKRHRGISHHSLTVLGKTALSPAIVVLPRMLEKKELFLKRQVAECGIDKRHLVVWENGTRGLEKIKETGIAVSTMGRGPESDREFFLAACAAGIYTGKMSVQVGLN